MVGSLTKSIYWWH